MLIINGLDFGDMDEKLRQKNLREAVDTMQKAPAEVYHIKGQEIRELQYFNWTYEETLRNVIVEGKDVSYGPAYKSIVKDGAFISHGIVYFGTNGAKATCNGKPITVMDIDNDPLSQIEPLDSFNPRKPSY